MSRSLYLTCKLNKSGPLPCQDVFVRFWSWTLMNSESHRIADQLRRAFGGDAWPGSPLSELLAGINAQKARARPLPSPHRVWELVLHIDIDLQVVVVATESVPMPHLFV